MLMSYLLSFLLRRLGRTYNFVVFSNSKYNAASRRCHLMCDSNVRLLYANTCDISHVHRGNYFKYFMDFYVDGIWNFDDASVNRKRQAIKAKTLRSWSIWALQTTHDELMILNQLHSGCACSTVSFYLAFTMGQSWKFACALERTLCVQSVLKLSSTLFLLFSKIISNLMLNSIIGLK